MNTGGNPACRLAATDRSKSSVKFEPTFGVENAGESLYPWTVGINSNQFEA